MPSASPKLLNLNQEDSSKKRLFWSNHYKIEFMVISLKEILELPNFGHTTTSTIEFDSFKKILLLTLSIKVVMSEPLFKNTFYFKN